MKTIVFHIGAGKTGSSAIQSGFARYNKDIKDLGINYDLIGDINQASQGKVTSGNAIYLLEFLCPSKRKKIFLKLIF